MDIWSTSVNDTNRNGTSSWDNAESQQTVINMNLGNFEAEEKRPRNEDSIWKEIREFSEQTTHHGVPYITNPKNHILRR